MRGLLVLSVLLGAVFGKEEFVGYGCGEEGVLSEGDVEDSASNQWRRQTDRHMATQPERMAWHHLGQLADEEPGLGRGCVSQDSLLSPGEI